MSHMIRDIRVEEGLKVSYRSRKGSVRHISGRGAQCDTSMKEVYMKRTEARWDM